MKYDIYFEEAKKVGITDLELYISSSSKLSFSLLHNELDNFSVAETYSLQARGIYNDKFGYVKVEKDDECTPKFVAETIKENALINET